MQIFQSQLQKQANKFYVPSIQSCRYLIGTEHERFLSQISATVVSIAMTCNNKCELTQHSLKPGA